MNRNLDCGEETSWGFLVVSFVPLHVRNRKKKGPSSTRGPSKGPLAALIGRDRNGGILVDLRSARKKCFI